MLPGRLIPRNDLTLSDLGFRLHLEIALSLQITRLFHLQPLASQDNVLNGNILAPSVKRSPLQADHAGSQQFPSLHNGRVVLAL